MNDARAAGDVERRLGNLIRMGTVEEVTYSPPRVRVRMGGILTAPIPWSVGAASATKVWSAPSVGEQVMVLSPSGDMAQGLVLRGVYSSNNAAPSDDPEAEIVVFPDGSRVEWAAGTITVKGVDKVIVDAPDIRLGSPGSSDPVVRKSDLQAAIDALKEQFDNHGHPTAAPGPISTPVLNASAPPAITVPISAQGSPDLKAD